MGDASDRPGRILGIAAEGGFETVVKAVGFDRPGIAAAAHWVANAACNVSPTHSLVVLGCC